MSMFAWNLQQKKMDYITNGLKYEHMYLFVHKNKQRTAQKCCSIVQLVIKSHQCACKLLVDIYGPQRMNPSYFWWPKCHLLKRCVLISDCSGIVHEYRVQKSWMSFDMKPPSGQTRFSNPCKSLILLSCAKMKWRPECKQILSCLCLIFCWATRRKVLLPSNCEREAQISRVPGGFLAFSELVSSWVTG